ncbi:putative Predicted membrane protein [Vibrio nigripulchritudo SOn1]|uniref:Predicted membrane protein n=1 Tax=Vibrio nigripulchritudo SOn1 TaxID=1238450 RepID=A0AAV2VJE2_9VIBR|nr:acyltransferase family protein [Vibrio nigripulchritudo]CCO44786.1 putative Predicted membrane protein [Vibrio nigripulchritudo SOn1]
MVSNPKKNRENINWIDFAKGVCILLVVFHHVMITSYHLPSISPNEQQEWITQFYELVNKKLAPLRMPLFFLISGFLVYRSATVYPWKDIFYKRIHNIWYIFIVWGVIQWGSITLIQDMSGSVERASSASNALYATSIEDFLALTFSGSSSLWYLYALPIYFIICKLFSQRPRLCVCLFLITHFSAQYFGLRWPTGSILSNGIFFAIGCFYGSTLFAILAQLRFKSLMFFACLFVFFVIFSFFGVHIGLLKSLLFISVAIVILVNLQKMWDGKILCWMGKNTLPIYVIHRILLEALALLGVPLLLDSFENGYWLTAWFVAFPFLATVVVTLVSLLIWKLTNNGYGTFLYSAPVFQSKSRKALKSQSV